MKLNSLSLLTLVVLPALSMARLRPHVKRDANNLYKDNSANCDSPAHKRDPPLYSNQPGNNTRGNGTPPSRTKTNPPSYPVSGGNAHFKGDPPPGSHGLLSFNTKYPGFLISSAVRVSHLDGKMDNCILPHYNMLVAEYESKNDKMEPQANDWVTGPTDTIIQYTVKHNMAFRLHTFFFDQTMSPVFAALKGNVQGLKKAMSDYIHGMMVRYGNVAYQIDVVNEIMAYDGGGEMKKDEFYTTLGNDYLPFAFTTAKEANKRPILFLNDNDIEGYHSKGLANKYSGLIKVIKDLQARNVPIDAIGLESHFEVGKVPAELPDVIGQFVSMGLKVMITELDIKNPNNQDAQQATDFGFVFESCVKHFPGCMGVNFWGLNDEVNWTGQNNRATLFDSQCNPKPAVFDAVKSVLDGTKSLK